MGGRGATRLAIKYPHLFCSLHNQAGNVLNLAMMGGQHDGDGRGLAPGWDAAHWEEYLMGFLGPDKSRFIDDDTFLNLEKNLDQIKGAPRPLANRFPRWVAFSHRRVSAVWQARCGSRSAAARWTTPTCRPAGSSTRRCCSTESTTRDHPAHSVPAISSFLPSDL